MRFETITDRRQVVVHDVPQDYVPMLRGIDFSDDGSSGTFTWTYPEGVPGWDVAAENWRRDGVTFVEQLVGVAPVDWESALEWIVEAATAVEADWFVLASAGLAARGVDVRPGGVDVAMDEAGADRLNRAAGRELLQPITACDWPVSRSYGRLFHGAPVQVIGGPLDQDFPAPWDSGGQAELEEVTWRGLSFRATSLDREIAHARAMARYDTVRAITRFRAEHGLLR